MGFRAEQLAELVFVAFAVDLFGKGRRAHDNRTLVRELVGESYADMPKLQRQLAEQLEAIKASYYVNSEAFAVAGYCYGGNIALEYVRGNFTGLRAAVSFHGTFLSAPSSGYVLSSPSSVVQVHHADDDFQDINFSAFPPTRAPVSILNKVEAELRAAGVERWTTLRYGKVGHAWTNPYEGYVYQEFEAISAHESSFALYRQLGLIPKTPPSPTPPTPISCSVAGAACEDGLICVCQEGLAEKTGRARSLLFASAMPSARCVCARAGTVLTSTPIIA